MIRTNIEIEEARDILLSHISPINEYEIIPAMRALGRICAENVYSPINAPDFPRSAMDGYAVRSKDITGASKDTPVTLKVIGQLMAGDFVEIVGAPNTAVNVMTGAYIPEGFDCVVMQEDTDYGQDKVSIYKAVKPYMNYSPAGEEFAKGELLIKKGTKIGRIEEFLLASAGITEIKAVRQPRISVYCTGSELVYPSQELPKGKIYNGLGYLLCASISNMGLKYADTNIIPDDESEIAENIRIGLDCSDMVITTGGVSVGKKDLVLKVLSHMGAEILFHRANIQPGTPTAAAILDGKPILCLSGNPFAAIANFDFYFPCIAAKMTGSDTFLTDEKTAVLAEPYEKISKHRRFIRARYENGKVYLPTDRHFSSVVGNLTECNCYIDLPENTKMSVNDMVKIRMINY